MKCEILIVAEHGDGKLDPISLDLISWACKIAAQKRWKVGAFALGHNLDSIVKDLSNSGIDLVMALDHAALEEYNSSAYLAAILPFIKQAEPRVVLTAHSYIGIEIAGGLAPQVKAPLVSNCVSVDGSGDGLLLSRPMFGGRFVADVQVDEARAVVATISKGSSAPKMPIGRNCEVVALDPPNPVMSKIKVIDASKPSRAEDITQADIVIAVGRGIQSKDQINQFLRLAETLGGALAASRPLVDLGWLTNDHQVGLSGVTVKPKVYLAFGISGSAQHVAGMKDSKLVIAINADANAPIFQVAHCGAVADMFEVLPPLLEKAKADDAIIQTGGLIAE